MGYKRKKGESISVVDVENIKFFTKTILRHVRVTNRDGRKKEKMTLCRLIRK